MYILVIGNPIDGFKFNGLFTNEADATTYGELAYPNTEWWIAPLVLKLQWQKAYEGHTNGYDGHVGAGEPTTVIKVVEDTCNCGHSWEQHQQNVHGLWVCGQCNCRGMQPPSDNQKPAADDF